jgi:flagellar biosynthesis protein FlhG
MTSATAGDVLPSPTEAAAAKKSNIIAIASGKGGVGKTWFAITLAHALARAGHRTLLFDGDLGLANVDVQLGAVPRQDLATVLAGGATLAEAATPHECGFDIIAGRSGSGGLASLAADRLLELKNALKRLARSYDFVVLDLGAGIERTVRQLTSGTRACLVVTTDEPTAITDAYAFIKVTAMGEAAPIPRIVVNMVGNERDGERTYNTLLRACSQFLKQEPPLAGIIRRDDHVKESIRRQMPLIMRYPNSNAAADVEKIATRLALEFGR